jgi:hypothetical protein
MGPLHLDLAIGVRHPGRPTEAFSRDGRLIQPPQAPGVYADHRVRDYEPLGAREERQGMRSMASAISCLIPAVELDTSK